MGGVDTHDSPGLPADDSHPLWNLYVFKRRLGARGEVRIRAHEYSPRRILGRSLAAGAAVPVSGPRPRRPMATRSTAGRLPARAAGRPPTMPPAASDDVAGPRRARTVAAPPIAAAGPRGHRRGRGLRRRRDIPGHTEPCRGSAARLGGRAIALAGLVVVAGVVLSRLLGWLRVAVFAAEYGTGPQTGAFFAAFRIPDTLFQLVAAGAVGSALVPVASALLANGEDQRARRLVATIANLMVVALVPLAIVVWLAAPAIVPVIDSTADLARSWRSRSS